VSSNLRLVSATPGRLSAPRLALIPADFEASDRARRRFVARAHSWGRGVARILEHLGGAFTAEPTDRGVELRASGLEGARVDLTIDRKHLDLSLDLRDVALDAFSSALHREGTMRWLAALPEQFFVRRGSHDLRASTADRAALQHAIDAARAESASVRIGWRVPRNLVLSHAQVLDEQLLDALRALALVEGAIAGRTPRPSALAQRVPASLATRARLASSGSTRMRLNGALGRPRIGASTTTTPTPIDRGARVRVLAGPFEGKVGVVQALDGRAARVLFGLLATRVELADLAPAHVSSANNAPVRRPRPAIASSHRAGAPGPGRRAP
jgi:hypothetical protein